MASDNDIPYMFSGGDQEHRRLDDMAAAIKNYVGDKLCFAILDEPRRILDIGSGTCFWAIDAATTYPSAQVDAMDLVGPPDRALPPNLRFRQGNVLNDLPFQPETFDILHMRFLLFHVPDAPRVLSHVLKLLRPGGLLLVEDSGVTYPRTAGTALRQVDNLIRASYAAKGLDPDIGRNLAGILHSNGSLMDINTHMAVLPLSSIPDDPKIGPLTRAMRVSAMRAISAPSTTLVDAGLTPKVAQAWAEEMNDPRYSVEFNVCFTWSRKRF